MLDGVLHPRRWWYMLARHQRASPAASQPGCRFSSVQFYSGSWRKALGSFRAEREGLMVLNAASRAPAKNIGFIAFCGLRVQGQTSSVETTYRQLWSFFNKSNGWVKKVQRLGSVLLLFIHICKKNKNGLLGLRAEINVRKGLKVMSQHPLCVVFPLLLC